jgi:hypothetical protein
MGMKEPETQYHNPKKLATDNGLFAKIQRDHRRVSVKYQVFLIATYILLVLQLLLGAIFIILGTLRSVDTHLAIAILGALSTIIAGVLALM